jgi:hypothetical protein
LAPAAATAAADAPAAAAKKPRKYTTKKKEFEQENTQPNEPALPVVSLGLLTTLHPVSPVLRFCSQSGMLVIKQTILPASCKCTDGSKMVQSTTLWPLMRSQHALPQQHSTPLTPTSLPHSFVAQPLDYQQTLIKSFTIGGIGLHSGEYGA